MTIKQRLQRIEGALRERSTSQDWREYMKRINAASERGMILCKDGVERTQKEWLLYHEELRPQFSEMFYAEALEAIKQGLPIDRDIKQYLKPFLKELDRDYHKKIKAHEAISPDEEKHHLKIESIRHAKTDSKTSV